MKKLTPFQGFIIGLFVILLIAATVVPIKLLQLQSDANGGGFCFTNLGCIQAVTITGTNGFFGTLNVTSNLTVDGVVVSPSNQVAIEDGYTIVPVSSSTQSNTFNEDFSQTNAAGYHLIYAKYQATNDLVLLGQVGLTRQWLCLSYVITASASPYIRIWYPTNGLVNFPTNYGPWTWYPSNQYLVLFLTNGQKFRDSIQTNDSLERQWIVK